MLSEQHYDVTATHPKKTHVTSQRREEAPDVTHVHLVCGAVPLLQRKLLLLCLVVQNEVEQQADHKPRLAVCHGRQAKRHGEEACIERVPHVLVHAARDELVVLARRDERREAAAEGHHGEEDGNDAGEQREDACRLRARCERARTHAGTGRSGSQWSARIQ